MSEVKSHKTKGASLKRLGENKVSLKPAIPFENKKADFNLNTEAANNNIVYIKVKVDPKGDEADRTNIVTKSCVGIQTFNKNGATIVLTIKSLNYDIYAHEGLTTPLGAERKLKFFQRLLVRHSARDSYLKIYIACHDAVINKYNLDETKNCEMKKDSSKFFKYLSTDDVVPSDKILSLSATDLAERKEQLVAREQN